MTIERPVHTYEYLRANQDKLLDREWLSAFLRPHCKCNKYLGAGWRGSRLRIIQYPWEFSGFLILMAMNNCRSYLEIGTSTGGSFLMADSYLRAAVPDYTRAVGYDRKSKLRDFDEYKAAFPKTEFRCQGSGEMNVSNEQFDAVFIDARHVERWVLHDYRKALDCKPKLIAFHDIRLRDSSVRPAFDQIKTLHKMTWEIIDTNIPQDKQWGIGVVGVNS